MSNYAWPRDTMAEKIAFYGDPRGYHGVSETWYRDNVVRMSCPWQLYYAGKQVHSFTFHRRCAEALRAALEAIWREVGGDYEVIKTFNLHEFGGTFNYRLIRGSNNLSNHSFAIAIDLAPSSNSFNAPDTDGDGFSGAMPHVAVKAFDDVGARWGGRYRGRKDPMHFEFVS